MSTVRVTATVKKDTKDEAAEILNRLGLSTSSAISMFLTQVVNCNGIPFDVYGNNRKE